MSANEELERQAVEQDPGDDAESKAAALRPALERQAEESERREGEELDSASDAPEQAGEGVGEHYREMVRRGFEKEGPPE